MHIDWSRIESLVDTNDPDGEAWRKDILFSLFENMNVRIQNLKQFLNQKAAKEVQSELHQIRGVAANFGLATLLQVVTEAEEKVKLGELDACIVLCTQINPAWEETKKQLLEKIGG